MNYDVAPFTGAWIEIWKQLNKGMVFLLSLPSRGRGLKLIQCARCLGLGNVAPFTGAWIEIIAERLGDDTQLVAPFTGAWIEILSDGQTKAETL